jgi:hypothetical protein
MKSAGRLISSPALQTAGIQDVPSAVLPGGFAQRPLLAVGFSSGVDQDLGQFPRFVWIHLD